MPLWGYTNLRTMTSRFARSISAIILLQFRVRNVNIGSFCEYGKLKPTLLQDIQLLFKKWCVYYIQFVKNTGEAFIRGNAVCITMFLISKWNITWATTFTMVYKKNKRFSCYQNFKILWGKVEDDAIDLITDL